MIHSQAKDLYQIHFIYASRFITESPTKPLMILKQDRTLEKQDELLVEVKDMNRSMNEKSDQLIKKQDDLAVVKADIAEIKTALKAKGIM